MPQRRHVAGLAVGFVALLAGMVLFGEIAEDVHAQEASFLDAVATPLLHGIANPTLDAIMRAITGLGSIQVIAPLFIGALAWLSWRRDWLEARFLAVAVLGSVGLNEILKLIFHRPRPTLSWATIAPEYSFPSGHSMNSLVFYLALALIAWTIVGRRAGTVAVVIAVALALLIGTSRIYLGYHYLTDVVGGLLAGASWLVVVTGTFLGRRWLRRWREGAAGTTSP